MFFSVRVPDPPSTFRPTSKAPTQITRPAARKRKRISRREEKPLSRATNLRPLSALGTSSQSHGRKKSAATGTCARERRLGREDWHMVTTEGPVPAMQPPEKACSQRTTRPSHPEWAPVGLLSPAASPHPVSHRRPPSPSCAIAALLMLRSRHRVTPRVQPRHILWLQEKIASQAAALQERRDEDLDALDEKNLSNHPSGHDLLSSRPETPEMQRAKHSKRAASKGTGESKRASR